MRRGPCPRVPSHKGHGHGTRRPENTKPNGHRVPALDADAEPDPCDQLTAAVGYLTAVTHRGLLTDDEAAHKLDLIERPLGPDAALPLGWDQAA